MRKIIIMLSLISLLSLAPIDAQDKSRAVESAKPAAPIAVEPDALKELREAANQAALVRQAVAVAEQILTDRSSSCFNQSLATLNEAALSRENKRDAMILAYRYRRKIPESYLLDLDAGAFVPPPSKP